MTIKIGILGAIGVDDIGDIVLLQQAINDISIASKEQKSNVEFIIFSFDKAKTYSQIAQQFAVTDIQMKVVSCLKPNEVKVDNWFVSNLNSNKTLYNSISNDDYLHNLLNCDALYFIGGGYFNDYWGDKLWSTFIIPVIVFKNIKKPVFISSITVGPFSSESIERLYGVFSEVHTLCIRDHSKSINLLKELGYTKGNLLLNSDDILVNWMDSKESINDLFPKKYMVLHLFHWAEKYSKDLNTYYQNLADFLDYIIDKAYVEQVVFLPFNHFRDNKKGGDYIYGEKLNSFIKHKQNYLLMEPLENYHKMREIIKNASFVIANRYHPIVFSLGEKTPALGIYVNDLYKQKLQGTYEVLNINPDQHTKGINDFSVEDLIEWHKENVLSKNFSEGYDDLVMNYREQKLRNLKSFLNQIF